MVKCISNAEASTGVSQAVYKLKINRNLAGNEKQQLQQRWQHSGRGGVQASS